MTVSRIAMVLIVTAAPLARGQTVPATQPASATSVTDVRAALYWARLAQAALQQRSSERIDADAKPASRPGDADALRSRYSGELAGCFAQAGDRAAMEEVLAAPDAGANGRPINDTMRALLRCECLAHAGNAVGAAKFADDAIASSAEGEAREKMRLHVIGILAETGFYADAQSRAAQLAGPKDQLSAWLALAGHAGRANDSAAYATAMAAAERAVGQIGKSDAEAGAEALSRAIIVRIGQGEFDVARRLLVQLPPVKQSEVRVRIANAAIARGDRAGCIAEMDAALAADPTISPDLARLAARVGHQRIIDRAIATAEKTYKSGLGRSYIIVWLASGYTGPNAVANARRLLDRWEAGQVNRANAQFERSVYSRSVGLHFIERGDRDGAIALTEDVPLQSRSPMAQSVIVRAHAEMGRAAEAIAAYKQLGQINARLHKTPRGLAGPDPAAGKDARRWLVGGLLKSGKSEELEHWIDSLPLPHKVECCLMAARALLNPE